MVRIIIDNQTIDVPEGSTILQAAEKLGIRIPTLCHLDGCSAMTSCYVCVVQVEGHESMVPSCATLARDGMKVRSETDDVRLARKTAIELLLSDHVGDCMGPCQIACPGGMNIPLMLRQTAAGDIDAAIRTIKYDIPLPATLGRICPAPCEKACRRRGHDSAIAICLLHKLAADADIAGSQPFIPECKAGTGKRVVIAGGGPAGLSAAYFLRQAGHEVTVIDDNSQAGGMIRRSIPSDRLPGKVLDAEIAVIQGMGVQFELNKKVGRDISVDQLRRQYEAVLMATGAVNPVGAELLADEPAAGVARIFAAGAAIGRARRLSVQAVADGRAAAGKIDRYLSGQPIEKNARRFNSTMGRLLDGEIDAMLAESCLATMPQSAEGQQPLTPSQAAKEAARCLHCDCRKGGTAEDGEPACKLKYWAQTYGASTKTYKAQRKQFEHAVHPQVIFESGKCIRCGLCIEITQKNDEPVGLCFIGRGYDLRVGAPLGRSLAEALTTCAVQCADACPTGAISIR